MSSFIVIFGLIGWVFATDFDSKNLPPIYLYTGEQRVLRITGLERFSVGGPATRATSRGDTILIKGTQTGGSDLWVWKSDGSSEHRSIIVVPTEKAHPTALDRALGSLEQAEIVQGAEGTTLRGTIDSYGELRRIGALSRGFPKQLRDETEPTPELVLEGEKRLGTWIDGQNLSNRIRLERRGSTLWIRGAIDSKRERERLEREARNAYPKVELEIAGLPDENPVVHFKVFLLEIKRSRFGAFGVQWPELISQAATLTTQSLAESIRLDLAIQALEGDGSARVLSNPELVVRAPGEAELFAGGELPIRNTSAYFANVAWKTFGLSLKLNVTHVAGDRVRVDIQTEVSNVAPAMSQDSTIPALEANRMKTQVDARFGTPLLLSGLLKQSVQEKSKGLPLLHRIPVIGSLFGTDEYVKERSELVAVLLPSAAPPRAPMEEMQRATPKGPVPPPRNWMSLDRERKLRSHPGYPWNAFGEGGGNG